MLGDYDSDHAGSGDMDEILEMSLFEHQNTVARANGPSNGTCDLSHTRKQDLQSQVAALDTEIRGVDAQIKQLQGLRRVLVAEKEALEGRAASPSGATHSTSRKGKGRAGTIDYTTDFRWSSRLKATMTKVFGIKNFRLCQKGVCNANLDGRDVVCVMPTGGGKSLTYQLPALLTPGCTLVISPLISLITDQILHLREAGVEAAMLTGGTPTAEANQIQQRLIAMASSQGDQGTEIKLCYVTPEKISKSKRFKSLLNRLVEGGKLARIVVDEAHCVSQLGHDFRPDYKRLSELRQLFPRVPISALSATCPPKVLDDILKILGMKPVVDGKAVPQSGTVYFSAPLYRKNLHYSILPKPASAKSVILAMTRYILDNHKNDSGIVYCFSKKDAASVAQSLQELSDKQIKTGVYHSNVPDAEKEQLHKQWREGSVQVVCATIAFGLGIDKGNVRFVLHHTIPKSLDGFYQESGRAGRDGRDADCILFYRPQDVTRQSSLTCSSPDNQTKLYDMLRFAQDLRECRKILFAKYFSVSSDLAMTSWTTEELSATDRCGHCDNCTRPPETVDHRDVTVEAWKLLKILESVNLQGGRLTIARLSDLARGLGGGSFETVGKRGSPKKKARLDYSAVAEGKVGLSKEDTEVLVVHLLTSRYLGESFSSTEYTINVYVVPGQLAIRLTLLSMAQIRSGDGPRVYCSFRLQSRKRKGRLGAAHMLEESIHSDEEAVAGPSVLRPPHPLRPPRKRYHEELDEEESVVAGTENLEDSSDDVRMIDDGSDAEDQGWVYSMRPTSSQAAPKRRTSARHGNQPPHDVISLSSD